MVDFLTTVHIAIILIGKRCFGHHFHFQIMLDIKSVTFVQSECMA